MCDILYNPETAKVYLRFDKTDRYDPELESYHNLTLTSKGISDIGDNTWDNMLNIDSLIKVDVTLRDIYDIIHEKYKEE